MFRRLIPVLLALLIAWPAMVSAEPPGGRGGRGGAPAPQAPGPRGSDWERSSPGSGLDRGGERAEELRREADERRQRAAAARGEAAGSRDAGLAQAEESRRKPPEEAVGFWERARAFFGFEKSAEEQAAEASSHERASEQRPVGD